MEKLHYFGHLMQRASSLEKTLMLEKIEGKRRRWQQRMKWLDSNTDSMDMNPSKLQEIMMDRRAWHAAFHGVARSWTQHRDYTTATKIKDNGVSQETPNNKTCQPPAWERGGPRGCLPRHAGEGKKKSFAPEFSCCLCLERVSLYNFKSGSRKSTQLVFTRSSGFSFFSLHYWSIPFIHLQSRMEQL